MPATEEAEKPKRVSTPATNYPEDYRRQLVNNTVPYVRAAEQNSSYTVEKATPVTAETPIADHQIWQQVGAERVGSEEPNMEVKKRDAKHLWRLLTSKITGTSIWARLGRGLHGIHLGRMRNRDKTAAGLKPDSDQLDVGE